MFSCTESYLIRFHVPVSIDFYFDKTGLNQYAEHPGEEENINMKIFFKPDTIGFINFFKWKQTAPHHWGTRCVAGALAAV